jgi:hypothetical protein
MLVVGGGCGRRKRGSDVANFCTTARIEIMVGLAAQPAGRFFPVSTKKILGHSRLQDLICAIFQQKLKTSGLFMFLALRDLLELLLPIESSVGYFLFYS